MIRVEQISTEETQKLNQEEMISYWALPMAFTIILLFLEWIFNIFGSSLFYLLGAVCVIFIIPRLIMNNPNRNNKIKIIRRGKIINAAFLGNNPIAKLNIGQHIDITLETEPVPEPYKPLHVFTIWKATGTTFFKQDPRLRYQYKELIGKDAELEYIPENGLVIAFKILND